ncbi:hypothetical protein TNCV_1889071 [Trichonephila clavipes]|nr:hypothetical protein TNCV_1889071 [Trichonephila clavipes]
MSLGSTAPREKNHSVCSKMSFLYPIPIKMPSRKICRSQRRSNLTPAQTTTSSSPGRFIYVIRGVLMHEPTGPGPRASFCSRLCLKKRSGF